MIRGGLRVCFQEWCAEAKTEILGSDQGSSSTRATGTSLISFLVGQVLDVVHENSSSKCLTPDWLEKKEVSVLVKKKVTHRSKKEFFSSWYPKEETLSEAERPVSVPKKPLNLTPVASTEFLLHSSSLSEGNNAHACVPTHI